MTERHARSGISHDFTNLFSHNGFVTMDRAFGTRGFIVSIEAFVNALSSIGVQLPAFGA